MRSVCRASLFTTGWGFGSSGLRLDTISPPLTHSWFPPGDGEKRRPVTTVGACTWPTMANAETNGETDDARNHGQMWACGNGYAVNKLCAFGKGA